MLYIPFPITLPEVVNQVDTRHQEAPQSFDELVLEQPDTLDEVVLID